MLLQGAVRARPNRGSSQAHPGIYPLSPLTHRTQRFQPLPEPLGNPPYHMALDTVRPGIAATVRHDEILLHYYRSFPAVNPHGIVPLLAPPDFTGN